MDHEAYIEMAEAEEAHWWFQGRRRLLQAVIADLKLPEAAFILELGSGTGGNFEMLSRFGQLTAVEANDLARALSVRKAWGTVQVMPGVMPDGLPAFPRKFDLVCLFDVLEHIEDDEKTLRVIKDLLAPKGVVILIVPAFPGLWGRHDEKMHHKRRYGRIELMAKLHCAGFKTNKLSYCNMFLFPIAVAVRLADRFFKKNGKVSVAEILPTPINWFFALIFGFERFFISRINLPIGLSLLAVARIDQTASGPI